MRLFIIANRLPIRIFRNEDGQIEFQNSEGGLVTGLNSLDTKLEKHWIGWPGMNVDNKKERVSVKENLEKSNYHPIFLSTKQINYYYEGYSNSTLWPLFHYFYTYIEFENRYWNTYKEVNHIFAEKTLEIIRPGDIIWVQDFQLMLLPQLLRDKIADLKIGYFHHVPFPSYEFFRVLPERAELLNGLLGADLIGFHTPDYMRHFISTVERVLHRKFTLDRTNVGRRSVQVNAFPMGINYKKYHGAPNTAAVKKFSKIICENYGNSRLILSVDRLDYSKGIIHRIKGFAKFLKDYPEYHNKVSLVMVTVPSRDKVARYAQLKRRIDEAISSLNGKYSTIGWTPIYYFYHSLEFEELSAMYNRADIALITPLRDGMNLVAKEYIASKRNSPGVLILSEMAGAAIELNKAIIINPNDISQIEASIVEALRMPIDEQMSRLRAMQKRISTYDVRRWAHNFVGEITNMYLENTRNNAKVLSPTLIKQIKKDYHKAKNRLLLFDYDGTLSAFYNHAEEAFPRQNVLDLLERFNEDKKNHLLLNSGRDRKNLEDWFGTLAIDLEAEHGAAYKKEGIWHERVVKIDWNKELLRILQSFVDSTPGAYLEEKETALVWHFRNVDNWLGILREKQLMNALMTICSRLGLQVMRGNKIVEIKTALISKSTGTEELLKENDYDFILCLGDDVTDEDMFRILPPSAYSVKIGKSSDIAKYNMPLQEDVIDFLQQIVD